MHPRPRGMADRVLWLPLGRVWFRFLPTPHQSYRLPFLAAPRNMSFPSSLRPRSVLGLETRNDVEAQA